MVSTEDYIVDKIWIVVDSRWETTTTFVVYYIEILNSECLEYHDHLRFDALKTIICHDIRERQLTKKTTTKLSSRFGQMDSGNPPFIVIGLVYRTC